MFEAVFKLPPSKLSQIPTFNTSCASPYHTSAYDAIQYMEKFTFPNVAPAIRKYIIDRNEDENKDDSEDNDDYFRTFKNQLKGKGINENITVRLARTNYHIFILYRGTVGKIPLHDRFLALVKDAPIWDSYRSIFSIIELEESKMR